jgi:hypothetical protein
MQKNSLQFELSSLISAELIVFKLPQACAVEVVVVQPLLFV